MLYEWNSKIESKVEIEFQYLKSGNVTLVIDLMGTSQKINTYAIFFFRIQRSQNWQYL